MNALVNLIPNRQPNYNGLNPVLQLKHPYWLVGRKISVVSIGIGPRNNWHISFTASKIFALVASSALLMSILPSSSLIRAIVSLPTFLVVFPLSNIINERILGMPSILSFIMSFGISISYLTISNSGPLLFRIALIAIPCLFSICSTIIGLKISGFPDCYMKNSVIKDILGIENYQHMMQDSVQVEHYSWEKEEIEKID